MARAGIGRPSKPTALRRLHGDHPERLNDAEPIPSLTGVVAPAWLSAAARELWDRLAPDLESRRVLTTWDAEAFGTWCDAAAQHARAAREVDQRGLVVAGARGPVKNPACQLVRDYAQIMVSVGARFGLTPSDRVALSVVEPARDRREDLLSDPSRLLSR